MWHFQWKFPEFRTSDGLGIRMAGESFAIAQGCWCTHQTATCRSSTMGLPWTFAERYCRKASYCITEAANHRQLAYGGAASQNTAWAGTLARGLSRHAENDADRGIVCSWSTETRSLKTHDHLLKDGTRVWVHKQRYNTLWTVRARPTSIWIHMGMHKRFRQPPSW